MGRGERRGERVLVGVRGLGEVRSVGERKDEGLYISPLCLSWS